MSSLSSIARRLVDNWNSVGHLASRSFRSQDRNSLRPTLKDLRQVADRELRQRADDLRHALSHNAPPTEAVTAAFSLAFEAVRRTLRVELYEEQLQTARVMGDGGVAEMQTGEGKTLACVPAAVLHGLTGHGVHVATPNAYLAARDYGHLQPTYELLGLSVGLLTDRGSVSEKRGAYDCDITYGTGYEFGFDYLRDQLLRRRESAAPLGHSLLQQVRGVVGTTDQCMQRSRSMAIIDEVDDVLIDDAGAPLVLSDASPSDAADAKAHVTARDLALTLKPDVHFRGGRLEEPITLTTSGKERIFLSDVAIPVHQLRRSWNEYVELALRAEWILRRDVHYVVQDREIQIVDGGTGRILVDRSWRDGLHQAIEAKEGLVIHAEKQVLAQISRQRFYRLYDQLAGMTGTAGGCEREFNSVYGLRVCKIPLRVASRRRVLPSRCFVDAEAKWRHIADDVKGIHVSGRPILIGTRTIEDSEILAARLRRVGLPFQLLNGLQDADEAEVVSKAGALGAITLATNLAGRGTDIQLADGVTTLGGLHVIVAEPHECSRVDRQLIGRCARQGDPGSSQLFVSLDDTLIRRYGPWLRQPIAKSAGSDGEARFDLSRRIRRMQRAAEREKLAARAELLRRDVARDSLIARLTPSE